MSTFTRLFFVFFVVSFVLKAITIFMYNNNVLQLIIAILVAFMALGIAIFEDR